MNDSSTRNIHLRLMAAQVLIMINCYFCFTYIYEAVLIYISWIMVPVAVLLWLSTKPWRYFKLNFFTIIQLSLFLWIVLLTIFHKDTSINSQMLLLGFFLFFIMGNVYESEEEAQKSSKYILVTALVLSSIHCILGLVMAGISPARFTRIGISTNPNHLGAFCFIGIVSSIRMYELEKEKGNIVRISIAFLFLLNLCTLVFSGSRAAFFGIVAFFLLYFLISVYKKIEAKKLYWIIFTIIVISACVLLVVYIFHRGYTFGDNDSLFFIFDKLSSGRLIRWSIGMQVIQDNPIFGLSNHDYGEFIATFLGEPTGQHNVFMGLGVYYGIVAMLLLAILIIGIIVTSVRIYKRTFDSNKRKWLVFWFSFIMALLVNDMFETYIFFLHMPNSFLFFLGTGYITKFYQDSKQNGILCKKN